MPLSLSDLQFVCPQCRDPVRTGESAYHCDPCGRLYPVRFGIPDFRLRADLYLDLPAEIDKATRLAKAAEDRTFDQLLDYYYEITDDVPPELAQRYKAAVHNGIRHADLIAIDLAESLSKAPPGAIALDAGCGAGAMLVAADRRSVRMIGVDIALRWLVICRKRLDELGLSIPLVCADLAEPPFAPGCFDAVTAVDLVEHVPDVPRLLRALAKIATPGASIWLTAANARTLGPHPSTRVWAIGWIPPGMRTRLLKWLRGVDSLRHSNLVTPAALQRMAERAGFVAIGCIPRRIAAPDHRYSRIERVLIRLYRRLAGMACMNRLMLLVGPAFEMRMRRTHDN